MTAVWPCGRAAAVKLLSARLPPARSSSRRAGRELVADFCYRGPPVATPRPAPTWPAGRPSRSVSSQPSRLAPDAGQTSPAPPALQCRPGRALPRRPRPTGHDHCHRPLRAHSSDPRPRSAPRLRPASPGRRPALVVGPIDVKHCSNNLPVAPLCSQGRRLAAMGAAPSLTSTVSVAAASVAVGAGIRLLRVRLTLCSRVPCVRSW